MVNEYAQFVEKFSTERIQTEIKQFTFIKQSIEKTGLPFPCPFLEALKEEVERRYDTTRTNTGD